MPTDHPLSMTCPCDRCAYNRERGFHESEVRKAAATSPGGALAPLLEEFGTELAAYVADPARPDLRFDVSNPKGQLAAVVRILRPDSPAALAKATAPGDVPNQDPSGGVPSPEWERALSHQLQSLQAQLKGNKNDLDAALKLVNEMRDALLAASTSGPRGITSVDTAARARQVADAFGGTFAGDGVQKAADQKAEKAKLRKSWQHADVGRWSRATSATDKLRLSDELSRFEDIGAAVQHDQARDQHITKAAARLKVEADELRPSSEVGLKKGTAAAIGHDERREDHLFELGQQLAG